MSVCWKWVFHNGTRLYDVGIQPDGTQHNPNGYPEDEVRAACHAAEARRHERRSEAAKKAAVTRERRIKRQVYATARKIVEGQATGPRRSCCICGRGLADDQSIARGIGSECWQEVLTAIYAMRAGREPVGLERRGCIGGLE